jgi:hypothetical protein
MRIMMARTWIVCFEFIAASRTRRTYAQLAAEGQFNAAIKGKTDAAREIADRLEGEAVQPLSGDPSSSMSVTVNIELAREKLFGE